MDSEEENPTGDTRIKANSDNSLKSANGSQLPKESGINGIAKVKQSSGSVNLSKKGKQVNIAWKTRGSGSINKEETKSNSNSKSSHASHKIEVGTMNKSQVTGSTQSLKGQ